MTAPYTVHEGDGLLAGRASIRAEHRTREAANAAASDLVRSGVRMAEVRQAWRLLDTWVLRGSSPRHIYTDRTRGHRLSAPTLFPAEVGR